MPAVASPKPATPKADKKHKKDKSSKSDKKRAREEDAVADADRKHKKSKSVTAPAVLPEEVDTSSEPRKKDTKKSDKKSKHGGEAALQGEDASTTEPVKESKKKHKKKHKEAGDVTNEDAAAPMEVGDEGTDKKQKKKKNKDAPVADEVVDEAADGKKKKRSKKHAVEVAENATSSTQEPADPDAMDVDQPTKSTPSIYQPPDMPANPQFPFFSQTVSLYEPLYPTGWAQPVSNAQYQHLQHLQNKYVPSLRGVLLDYKNVAIGPTPGRQGAATDDDTPTTVLSQNEYAVGFGWITADVELFVPSRGAWMEGSVNLQTEGHIGVVCFGKFNASIEARRLPPAWKWVSNESPDAQGFEETASVITADDHGVVRQVHSTGFWVDGSGNRVKGKIRFRIRNFDAGTSGETSYLSLEGTMLDKDSEKKLVKEEARTAQMRREKKGGQKTERRRAPDFSMTRFVDEEEEEQQQQQQAEAQESEEANPEPWTVSRAQSEEQD